MQPGTITSHSYQWTAPNSAEGTALASEALTQESSEASP